MIRSSNFLIRLFLPGFAAAAALLISSCQQKTASAQAPQMPPPDVGVVNVVQKDVPIVGEWVATLQGYTNANISPQVTGYLIRQNYREGSLVHKGDVLFEIDPRPFQAALDQAKGQLAQAKGQLAQAQAQLGLQDINVRRDTPLAKARAIAQSQLDNDVQGKAQAEAAVQADQAAIQAAEAAVENAQINMGFTEVRSLVTGIAGIATTQIGNLVNQSTILTTVSQVNPIRAYFPISEQEYLAVAEKIKPGQGDWLRRSESVPLTLTLANGQVFAYKGKIIFIDRQVNSQTGTITIVGAFPNPENILRPGQFGRVSAVTRIQRDALLIPQRAVSQLQGQNQVAVVGADNKVNICNVTLGPQIGSMWVVESGLREGDRVITEGNGKVRSGMPVNPKPDTSDTSESK